MSGRCVIERRGNRALHIDDVIVAKLVEFLCRHALFDVWRNEVEHFRGEAACHAHFFDVLGSFERDVHSAASEEKFSADYIRRYSRCPTL